MNRGGATAARQPRSPIIRPQLSREAPAGRPHQAPFRRLTRPEARPGAPRRETGSVWACGSAVAYVLYYVNGAPEVRTQLGR